VAGSPLSPALPSAAATRPDPRRASRRRAHIPRCLSAQAKCLAVAALLACAVADAGGGGEEALEQASARVDKEDSRSASRRARGLLPANRTSGKRRRHMSLEEKRAAHWRAVAAARTFNRTRSRAGKPGRRHRAGARLEASEMARGELALSTQPSADNLESALVASQNASSRWTAGSEERNERRHAAKRAARAAARDAARQKSRETSREALRASRRAAARAAARAKCLGMGKSLATCREEAIATCLARRDHPPKAECVRIVAE